MAYSHEFTAHINWTGSANGPTIDYKSYSRDYEIFVEGCPPLKGTADPAFLGVDDRYNPEDLLVASLSACHLLSYLALCSRKKVQVIAYQDNAWGKMEMKDGALRFTEVILRPNVIISTESNMELAERLHHEAHKSCFIANSVNFPVSNDATISTGG
jgi:organic hydroperoxide reductase OsmC/OhrA